MGGTSSWTNRGFWIRGRQVSDDCRNQNADMFRILNLSHHVHSFPPWKYLPYLKWYWNHDSSHIFSSLFRGAGPLVIWQLALLDNLQLIGETRLLLVLPKPRGRCAAQEEAQIPQRLHAQINQDMDIDDRRIEWYGRERNLDWDFGWVWLGPAWATCAQHAQSIFGHNPAPYWNTAMPNLQRFNLTMQLSHG